MALKLQQPSGLPLGQFDGLDTEILTLKGGEVVTFTSVSSDPEVDRAAYDVFDGYTNTTNKSPAGVKRTAVTRTLTASSRPLFLSDDGINGYGTLFGVVIGGMVGPGAAGTTTSAFTGVPVGPHTALASGKVTLWGDSGLFAVSLDSTDQNATTGLQPTNQTLNTGDRLTYTSNGLLTPVGSPSAVGGAPVVGTFVEFEGTGGLVNTPSKYVSGLNHVGKFSFAIFYWNPPAG